MFANWWRLDDGFDIGMSMKDVVPKAFRSGKDFRFFLRDELTSRCERNPNYSLRSFAKHLSVAPSSLSSILSGKRPITDKMKQKLGLRLGLSLEQLARMHSSPHGNCRRKAIEADGLFSQLSLDTFAVISEPHHYALLELMKTADFHWDPAWIGRRLGKTVSEIKSARERLLRLGLLRQDDNGLIFDATEGFSTDLVEGLTSDAHRRYQTQSLRHAQEMVQKVAVDLRDNTSIVMAINPADIPEAKKLLKHFRRRFCTKLESSANLKEVYQLTLSFVPVTRLEGR